MDKKRVLYHKLYPLFQEFCIGVPHTVGTNCAYPVALEYADAGREALRELMAERPVTLLVSENKSASFSSTAYVPSSRKKK